MDVTPADIEQYLSYATSAIGVFSLIAAFTPTPIDNAVLVALKKLVNVLGANFGGAENMATPGDAASVAAAKASRHMNKRGRGSRKS